MLLAIGSLGKRLPIFKFIPIGVPFKLRVLLGLNQGLVIKFSRLHLTDRVIEVIGSAIVLSPPIGIVFS